MLETHPAESEHEMERVFATADNASLSPQFAEDKIQFTLNEVLAVVWALSAMLGAWRIHFTAIPFVGLPVAMLGCTLLLRRPLFSPCMRDRLSLKVRFIFVSAPVFWALLICGRYGRPGNMAAWVLLATPVLWAQCFALARSLRIVCIGMLPIGFYLWLFLASDPLRTYDPRCGRAGRSFCSALFISRDNNAALLERYLGPLKSEWTIMHDPWDGPSPVLGLVESDQLEQILAMLPDVDARKQVLLRLTDRDNTFRFHQGLLLAAVYTYGYPPHPEKGRAYDAQTWWDDHEFLFKQDFSRLIASNVGKYWVAQLEPKRQPASVVLNDPRTLTRQWTVTNWHGRFVHSPGERSQVYVDGIRWDSEIRRCHQQGLPWWRN